MLVFIGYRIFYRTSTDSSPSSSFQYDTIYLPSSFLPFLSLILPICHHPFKSLILDWIELCSNIACRSQEASRHFLDLVLIYYLTDSTAQALSDRQCHCHTKGRFLPSIDPNEPKTKAFSTLCHCQPFFFPPSSLVSPPPAFSPPYPSNPLQYSKIGPLQRPHFPYCSSPSKTLPCSTSGFTLSSKSFRLSRFTTTQLVSFGVLFVVLVVQFVLFSPRLVFSEPKQEKSRLRLETACRNPHIFAEPLPVSRPHRMSLLEDVRRVAKEFEYPTEEVNKGVKEFIRQMG